MQDYNKNANLNVSYMFFDVLFGLIAYLAAVHLIGLGEAVINIHYFAIAVVFIALVMVFNSNQKLYTLTLFFYIDRVFKIITQSVLFSSVIVIVLAFGIGHSEVKKRYFAYLVIFGYLFFIFSAFFSRYILRKTKTYALRTLFVGPKENYVHVIRFLQKNSMGLTHVGYICESEEMQEDGTDYLGTFDQMEKVIHDNAIDQVFIMQNYNKYGNRQQLIELCMELGVVVRELQLPYTSGHAQNYICSIGTYPMITYHNVSLNTIDRFIKRVFDIILSILGIIASSPIMLITAIAIKLDSPGPVIFKQERVGLNGRHFKMFKFRSMCNDAEAKKKDLASQNKVAGGLMFKIEDDPRITKVGKFIRKTSIDELPQFFNVLLGQMSLVGTRPPTLDEVAIYDTHHWRRLSIKPGITGMWQVSGRSTITDFDQVVALDKQYIDNWSLWMDIKILFKTAFQIVGKKMGAY